MEEDQARFSISRGSIKRVSTEFLVYDAFDMIGSIGGSLGLFLGFSFFDIICKCLDKGIELAERFI